MGSSRSDELTTDQTDGVSRREILHGVGGGGLAVAMMALGIKSSHAQGATPAATPATSTELSSGVMLESLSGVPIRDLPKEPFTLVMYRITMESGTSLPNAELPYVSMTYTEKGDFVCPPGGEGRFIYDAEGEIVDSGAHEMAYPEGMWCYTAPDTMDGIRYDGPGQGSLLGIEFVPTP